MTRRNITDEKHLPAASMQALGAAQGLVALLRDGISIARASSKLADRANKPGSGSKRDAASGREQRAASDPRDTGSNHRVERTEACGLGILSAAKLASKIATVNSTIDRFERQQNSWRKDLSGVSFGAERLFGVSKMEKSIAAGKGPSIAAGQSIWKDAALMGAKSEVSKSVKTNADRVAPAVRLVEGASVKRAIEAGTLPNRPSAAGDGSGQRFGVFGKQPGFLDAAAAIAAQPNKIAAPPIKRMELAEPTKRQSRGSADTGGGISIHSSPTVIINGGESRTDIERQVEAALRKHREKLFDELKQEAGRRDRAEY